LETLAESNWHLTGVYTPGAERRGKPISCFVGLYSDSSRIKNYEQVTEKDVIVFFDPATVEKLSENEKLLDGLQEDGIILFNTSRSPKKLVEKK